MYRLLSLLMLALKTSGGRKHVYPMTMTSAYRKKESRLSIWYYCIFAIKTTRAPPWPATLSWWWGFAPMTRNISKIWRWWAN